MAKLIDLTGKHFGFLKVLARVENTVEGRAQWRCLCVCGKEKVMLGRSLRRGVARSCGCASAQLQRQSRQERERPYEHLLDLSGLIFGHLKVLRKTSIPGQRARFQVCCLLCGTKKEVPRASLISPKAGVYGCGCDQRVVPDRPTKSCSVCRQIKAREEFHKNQASPDGLNYLCRSCALTKRREGKFLYTYVISIQDYEDLLSSQGGGCAICGCLPKEGEDLPVDHNHQTGKVRGLLCHAHNQAYGLLQENEQNILALLAYHRLHA